MNHDDKIVVPSGYGRALVATVMAVLFWTICLVGGVGILALSAMLVGGAIPFRYVGF